MKSLVESIGKIKIKNVCNFCILKKNVELKKVHDRGKNYIINSFKMELKHIILTDKPKYM